MSGGRRARRRRSAIAALSGLLTISCVSACGSSAPAQLNSVRVERAVANSILSERGLRATVACPANVPQQAGHTFTCQARLDVGTYPVVVTETNGSGHVRYENPTPLVTLKIVKVERAIRESISHQRHLSSTVVCPTEVLQQAGLTFTCEATVNGKQYPFTVTEIDSDGHVRYVAP